MFIQIEIKEKIIDTEKSSRINYFNKKNIYIYANRIKNKKIIQIEIKEIICL